MTYDPYMQQPPAPQPKKRNKGGLIAGWGCAGIAAVVIGGCMATINSSGSPVASTDNKPDTSAVRPTLSAPKAKAPAKPEKSAPKVVTFKVWGHAPAGMLGSLDIGYGSDSDTRKGAFKNGSFTATIPFNKDAMYYNINAQLQGSGDIHCSVTVDGQTKTGHASGGYNICDAQLSSGFLGGWD